MDLQKGPRVMEEDNKGYITLLEEYHEMLEELREAMPRRDFIRLRMEGYYWQRTRAPKGEVSALGKRGCSIRVKEVKERAIQ
ncbi:hypothetical protein KI387_009956, partial [Taxus chinensis]